MIASRSLLAALALAGVVLSAPAGAQVTVYRAPRPPLCGNGYCDAWRGEDARNCPEDCGAQGTHLDTKPHKWMSGDPVPPGFHVEKRRSLALLLSGGAVLGSFWILGAAVGGSQIHNGGPYAFIPVAGPFVAAGTYQSRSCSSTAWFCWDLGGAFYQTFEILSGIGQVTGAALLTAGLVIRRDQLIPGPLVPVPIVGPDHAGIGFVGTF